MCESRRTFPAVAGMRLDVCVSDQTELTRSAVQRLIHSGLVTVDGKAQKSGYMLSDGECIEVCIPQAEEIAAKPENIPLSILYEDADIAVIHKPQGMVVHPAPGHASGTLVNALLYHLTDLSGVGGALRPGIVHRIDKMTSGLIVVAKNDLAHQALSAQFAARTAHRRYVAIAAGNFPEDAGTVDAPIGRHPTDRKKMAIVANGRNAVTHWRVMERFGDATLLQLRLETGRTHQIRVHMASIRHPLLGDETYGSGKNKLGLAGQALHGYQLAFCHPTSQEPMRFTAAPPDWFMEALRRLGSKYDAESLLSALLEAGKDEDGETAARYGKDERNETLA